MNHIIDLDPLSYEYPSYESYPIPTQQYPYNVKLENNLFYNQNNLVQNTGYPNHIPNNIPTNIPQEPIPAQTEPQPPKQEPANEEKEIKPDIKKKRGNKNGKNFCSEKITDSSYPFYGCSVCNISYTALHELDQHVIIHKNRMTSYRLRLRNQYKKKQIKKEKRKLKKMKKIKQESELEIEIKPEDGYIGNEKAMDYKSKDNENINDTNEDKKETLPNKIENNDNNKVNNHNGNNDNRNNDNGNNNESNKSSENNKEADETELNNLEKIYKCFACQKQFTLSYYLKLHVRSHTGMLIYYFIYLKINFNSSFVYKLFYITIRLV